MMGYGRFDHVIDTLEGVVSRAEYVVGDSFTAADVYVGSGIGFGMQFGMIEKRPAFEQYWGRLSARPAAQRAQALKDRHTFKTAMDQEALHAMFPHLKEKVA